MNTLVITYDLPKLGQDYKTLIAELRRLGGRHPLLSVWTVKTLLTASQMREHIRKFVDSNDRVFVGSMSGWAWTTNVLEEPHRN